MIKKITKNITLIILFLAMIFLSFHIGRWTKRVTDTNVIADTLYLEKPNIDNPSLSWRFQNRRIKPAWERPVKYEDWMNESQNALKIDVKLEGIRIVSIRDNKVIQQAFPYTESFVWENGIMYSDRFKNPIHWTGIRIGCRYGFEQEVIPYIFTGINIKRIRVGIELNKNDLQADVSFRLW